MAEEGSCATQLINGEGEFNIAGLEAFTRNVKLPESGISYVVVAIIGPQSSGKSTLLNHLFRTNFLEMDASKGRSQTTKGIWIARAVGIAPCTVIMDVEGCDGKERGKKNETAFEKQIALFALVVSDVLLINMWCHDIGREQAGNRPLLTTVFQVMTQLSKPRKTTLLFVIRNKSMTPLTKLADTLRVDIQQIWDTVQKPQAFKDVPLSEIFNVEVTALSTYEHLKDQFKEEVGQLRQRFFNSIAPGGLAGDRGDVVPASGFSCNAEEIWKAIKGNRDLDLPAHRVMLASIRCDEIGSEQLRRFSSDKRWLSLEKAVQAGPISGFGHRLSSILDTYLSEYDTMTLYYDENVRKTKRQELESKAFQLVHPTYDIFLEHLHSKTLESFKMGLEQALHKGDGFATSAPVCTQACMAEFDFSCADAYVQQANWDASKVRGKLYCDIEAHASAVRSAKLAEIVTGHEKLIDEALIAPLESLFETSGKDTWDSIRKLLKRETDTAVDGFSSAISGFELDHSTLNSMVKELGYYARSVVEKTSKEAARKVLIGMKERFSRAFKYDKASMPRVWTGKEDIPAIIKVARTASLKLLAVMAAIRWDEKPDEVEDILFSLLMDGTDHLANISWEEVPRETTLITPIECNSLWKQFKEETQHAVNQATYAQEAHKEKNVPAAPAKGPDMKAFGDAAGALVGALVGGVQGRPYGKAAPAKGPGQAFGDVAGALVGALVGGVQGRPYGKAAGAAALGPRTERAPYSPELISPNPNSQIRRRISRNHGGRDGDGGNQGDIVSAQGPQKSWADPGGVATIVTSPVLLLAGAASAAVSGGGLALPDSAAISNAAEIARVIQAMGKR